jgi:hypothetical protein
MSNKAVKGTGKFYPVIWEEGLVKTMINPT